RRVRPADRPERERQHRGPRTLGVGPSHSHQWRMSDDIKDDWSTMMGIFDLNFLHAAATAPGGFNDPDMLEVGNGGMSETEYATHFGLWALMSAPLIAG